ncbi:hypothetical protein VNO77_17529 [Canavalia gladiata]|uniref:Uncharacterized protein n=1 Tax=Canavalia gladiata TaxID=3824 RepID=A0AAN9LJ54_CANGL
MPSVPVDLDLVPSLTIFHGGSSFHRLKNLEKSDRRVIIRQRVGNRGIDIVVIYLIAILSFILVCCGCSSKRRRSSFKYLIQLMDTSSHVDAVHDNNFISDLERTFSESLHIQDAQKSEDPSEGNDMCNVEDENLCGGIKELETKLNMMCLKKSATFPIPNMLLPSSSSDEGADISVTSEHSAQQTYSRSVSLPAPLKLISAMKGSREKHGESQMKLNVKWAPDVYDPVPTLISHTVRNKKQPKSRKKKTEKKNGKKGQKGNSSRGGSNKDKQFRKLGGNSGLCHKSMDTCDQVFGASTDLDSLDVRSQDAYCGTSFLKKSVTELHYSVAEAL